MSERAAAGSGAAMASTAAPASSSSAAAITAVPDLPLHGKYGPGCCGTKLLATGAIYLGFTSLGLLIASLGPALLGLQRQTGASAETLSFIFTLRSVGYLVGSAGSGAMLDKFPKSGTRALAVCLFLTAICTASIPFASAVLSLGTLCSTQGLAMGVLDTVGNVLIIFLHGAGAGPFMQGLHFVFSVGALCSPLLVRLAMTLSESGVDASGAFWTFAAVTASVGLWFVFVPTPPPRKSGHGAQTAGTGQEPVEMLEHGQSIINVDTPTAAVHQERCCRGLCTVDRGIILTTGALLGLYVGAETGFGGFILLYAQEQYAASEATGQCVCRCFSTYCWHALGDSMPLL